MREFPLAVVICFLSIISFISSLQAQGESFYKGKTIRIMVGFSPGGIVHLWARLIAQYMGK